ncbi:four helix bundle protein [Candidatus Margulisiibacteriota bacterium]
MSGFKRFEDIDAWQKARELNKEIFILTKENKLLKNDFSLKNQMRRSSISIMANIAEGFARKGDKEFAQFLYISRGSSCELKNYVYTCLDINYINKNTFTELLDQINEVEKIIYGLIKYLRKDQ